MPIKTILWTDIVSASREDLNDNFEFLDTNKANTATVSGLLDLKVDKTTTVNWKALTTNIILNKTDVGLWNVDNTSDLNKPISTVTQNALNAKENVANKDASWWYAWLTLFKINFKNALNTFTSFFTNSNTASRTYTFPDKDWTVAMTSDITWNNSWTNTWDNAVNSLYSWLEASKQDTLTAWTNITIVWNTISSTWWWGWSGNAWAFAYEWQTATAGQTVFNLWFDYVLGNNLLVYLEWRKQIYISNYNETDTNTITFVTWLDVWNKVEFVYPNKWLNWKGTYNRATAYLVDDAVSYNGSSYICILVSTWNLPTNTTYFDLLASKWDTWNWAWDMLKSENLSWLANYATARSNLWLWSAATSATTDFATALTTDDNYVTDAEKVKLTNLSWTNTGDQTITPWSVTATASQTVVTTPTYVIWNNKLIVFLNGRLQEKTIHYTETSTTSITFVTWLDAWTLVTFRILS